MRIGTWNLAGRWDDRHRDLLLQQECDVWLLTEVRDDVGLEGFTLARTDARMASRRAWAAVAAPRLAERADPHVATAAAEVDGVVFWSSILPWRGAGPYWPAPWAGQGPATADAVAELAAGAGDGPTVWGGDWNHEMTGPVSSGSRVGCTAIEGLVDRLGLRVVTADQPHRIEGCLSIDHVAVPAGWRATAERIRAEAGGARLSDHDAYVVLCERSPAGA